MTAKFEELNPEQWAQIKEAVKAREAGKAENAVDRVNVDQTAEEAELARKDVYNCSG